jgi:MFS transporter, OFA family, oxalate/formate antiporter
MNNSKRWLYLAVGTVVLLFEGLIYAWSLFRTPFSEIYTGWTVSQLSMTFTISICCFCIGGFIGGQLSKKLNVKIRFLITAVCLFIGFFGVSMLNAADPSGSLVKLYIFYGVFGGGGVGIGYNAVISTITKWFPDKVGLASGIMLMGFGLGSLLLGSIVTSLVGSMGLFPTFKLLAIAITVVLVVAAVVIKAPEAPAAPAKDEAAEAPKEESNMVDYTAGEMLKTSRFWIFFFWAIFLNSAGLMVINSAANISVAYGGSAILGMIVSLFNGAGRIVAGNNFDKFKRKTSTLINLGFMLIAGILLVIAGKCNSLVLVTVGLIFVGLAYGGTPTITSAYTSLSFGPKNFTTNFSITNFSLLPAAIAGPMISSKLLESAGGAYDSNFIAIIVFSVISIVLWVLLNGASKQSPNEGNK